MDREIIVNGRFLSKRVTGVERYGRAILQFIGDRVRIESAPLKGIAGHAWEQTVLPTKLTPNSILWSPANTGPLNVHNQALTIHDLSPLEHPEWFAKSFAQWYEYMLPKLAQQVQIIFTPSEYVKQKVKEHFNVENVMVTPNGVLTSMFRPNARQLLPDLPQKYILFVGSIQLRKNLAGLISVWNQIEHEFKDMWLIIAGAKGSVFQSTKLPQGKRIRFLNYISDDHLPGLYANAEAFVLPSFDEGFGLPALEAMACGTPTLVSNGGALPETVGEAGLIFNLAKPESLITGLQQILCDNELRQSLKVKGPEHAKTFSWQKTAELIWNTLHEI
jgi:glycosyltransferase involved in cell wall biosynthesis